MAVKMRLARRGRKKAPFYHIVIADARAPRDGKFIEKIGSYNPTTVPATIELDRQKAFDWLSQGVQPTDTVNAILKFKGVLYRKHLARGVKKGAMTQEAADQLLETFINAKEAKVAARFEKTSQEKLDFYARLSGTAAAKKVEAAPVEEQNAFREESSEVEVSEAEPTVEVVQEAEPTADVVKEAKPTAEVVKEAEPIVAEVKEAEPTVEEVKEAEPIVAEVSGEEE